MSKPRTKKDLTRDAFADFLVWLSPNEEESAIAYERLRFRLMTFFSHRKCLFPEELADETINRVVLKIGEEEIKNKNAYCYGVARNVFLESLRKEKEHENIDELQLKAEEDKPKEEDSNPCLDKCLRELPNDKRTLILEYFSKSKQAKIDLHKEMSERLKISGTALRMKILRIKKKLKVCMQECMAG